MSEYPCSGSGIMRCHCGGDLCVCGDDGEQCVGCENCERFDDEYEEDPMSNDNHTPTKAAEDAGEFDLFSMGVPAWRFYDGALTTLHLAEPCIEREPQSVECGRYISNAEIALYDDSASVRAALPFGTVEQQLAYLTAQRDDMHSYMEGEGAEGFARFEKLFVAYAFIVKDMETEIEKLKAKG